MKFLTAKCKVMFKVESQNINVHLDNKEFIIFKVSSLIWEVLSMLDTTFAISRKMEIGFTLMMIKLLSQMNLLLVKAICISYKNNFD